MTFENYILRIRRRVQDIRTSSKTVISDLTTSGVRWTSAELIEIANQAITDLVRLVNIYSENSMLRQLVGAGYFENKGTIAFSSSDSADAPSEILQITSLSKNDGRRFGYKLPKDFFEYVYDDAQPRADNQYFTVAYDIGASKRKVYLSESLNESLDYTGIYSKASYGAGDGSTSLFLVGLDDVLLDIAERECRDREHNWDRSQILDFRISYKLGIPLSQVKEGLK